MRSGPVWQGRSPLPPDSDCAQPPPGAPGSHSQQAAGARPQADPLRPRAAPEHGCAPHPSCFPPQPKSPPEKVLASYWSSSSHGLPIVIQWHGGCMQPPPSMGAHPTPLLPSQQPFFSQERGSDNLVDLVTSQQHLYLYKKEASYKLVGLLVPSLYTSCIYSKTMYQTFLSTASRGDHLGKTRTFKAPPDQVDDTCCMCEGMVGAFIPQ